jgi:hypothetical protein
MILDFLYGVYGVVIEARTVAWTERGRAPVTLKIWLLRTSRAATSMAELQCNY